MAALAALESIEAGPRPPYPYPYPYASSSSSSRPPLSPGPGAGAGAGRLEAATGPYARPFEVSRVVGPDCYYMGIIDFQQQWTWSKRLERMVKILRGADGDGLSAMAPDPYMKRFVEHLEDLLLTDPNSATNEG